MALVIVLAGGGTGGHIFPALALADCIRRREPAAKLHFIGTRRGLEVNHVPRAGYPLTLVPSRPLLGRGPLVALRGLATLFRGVIVARRILRGLSADLVIGVGGYASVPTVWAATLLRIPTVLIEPNARPGRANRLLAHFSRAVFIQFSEAFSYFPAGRTTRLGIPVREIRPHAEPAPSGRLRLLVLGGSQGARSINRAVTAILGELGEKHAFEITHQTGQRDYEEVADAYRRAGFEADVQPFFEDALERLVDADLVVARAGAATIAELCATGTASILVPYPHAADDHQTANARELERACASVVIPDDELASRLAAELRRLAGDPDRRRRMSEAAGKRGTPDAADRIWDHCRGLVRTEAGA